MIMITTAFITPHWYFLKEIIVNSAQRSLCEGIIITAYNLVIWYLLCVGFVADFIVMEKPGQLLRYLKIC